MHSRAPALRLLPRVLQRAVIPEIEWSPDSSAKQYQYLSQFCALICRTTVFESNTSLLSYLYNIISNALASNCDRRWFGAVESPCGSLETHSPCGAFGCQEPVSEYMAGRCERDAMEQMAHFLDWRRGAYHQSIRANYFAPFANSRRAAGTP